MLEDVTMSGESLFMVAQDVTEECSKLGVLAFWLTTRRMTEGISLAQAKRMECVRLSKFTRPRIFIIGAMGRVNNKSVLVEVRLKENHEAQDGEWDVITGGTLSRPIAWR